MIGRMERNVPKNCKSSRYLWTNKMVETPYILDREYLSYSITIATNSIIRCKTMHENI